MDLSQNEIDVRPAGLEPGVNLTDILPEPVLRDLLRDMFEVAGVRTTFNSCTGEKISQRVHQNSFCRSMELTDGFSYCSQCSAIACQRAKERGHSFTYRCHMGLAATVIPVFMEGAYLGALIFSGYMTDPQYMSTLEQILPGASGRTATQDELLSAPFIAYQRAQDVAKLLGMCASFISEAYQRGRVERELHRKSLQLLAEANARMEAEKLLGEAEFKALQSQINPHFLFNTLNAISQMSLLEGGVKTPKAIYSLSSLLRRCLRRADGIPPLREEIDYIREYLNIKQLMYRDRIHFELDIDPACGNVRVPMFTLQPLVENALLHGLEPKEEGGCLWLTVRREEGGALLIQVRDDGLGCTPQKLKELRDCALSSGRSDLTGLGLSNVILRLRHHFGAQFHWELDSAPGAGMDIRLHIPAEAQDPSDQ